MRKEKIRIAAVRGTAIKLRCRKEEHFYLQGVGRTDKEALDDLSAKLCIADGKHKKLSLKNQIEIYDAEYTWYEGDKFPSLMQVMNPSAFPEEYNYIKIPLNREQL